MRLRILPRALYKYSSNISALEKFTKSNLPRDSPIAQGRIGQDRIGLCLLFIRTSNEYIALAAMCMGTKKGAEQSTVGLPIISTSTYYRARNKAGSLVRYDAIPRLGGVHHNIASRHSGALVLWCSGLRALQRSSI